MKVTRSNLTALIVVLCSIAPALADAEAYLVKCRLASKQNDRDAAIELCSAALKGDLSGRKRLEVYDLRARSYQDTEQYALAIKDYGEVIRLDPEYQIAYINRGIAYRASGDLDAAIRDFDKAIAITPGIALAYSNRGNAYRAKGAFDLAIKDFDLAIKLDPTDARHFNNRAGAYADKGDSEPAIVDFTRAIELDPELAPAFMDRANLLNRKGEFEGGLADAARGVELDPADLVGWWAKGWAEYGLARYPAAAQSLANYVKIQPDDAYGVMMLYFAETRAGKSGIDTLRTNAKRLDASHWPMHVVRQLLGEVREDDLSLSINTLEDSTCDQFFYLGQNAIVKGRTDVARKYLEIAAESCRASLPERAVARAELSRL